MLRKEEISGGLAGRMSYARPTEEDKELQFARAVEIGNEANYLNSVSGASRELVLALMNFFELHGLTVY